jgi:hypothetical protein
MLIVATMCLVIASGQVLKDPQEASKEIISDITASYRDRAGRDRTWAKCAERVLYQKRRGKPVDPAVAIELRKILPVTESALTRIEVIRALGSFGRSAVHATMDLEQILESLQSGEWSQICKVHAAVALGQIHGLQAHSRSARFLTNGLSSKQPEVRWCCAEGIGNLGHCDNNQLMKLQQLLRDEHGSVRVLAAGALWKLNGVLTVNDVLPVLRSALSEEPLPLFTKPEYLGAFHETHRIRAAFYLGEMGSHAEPALIDLTNAAQRAKDENDPWFDLLAEVSINRIKKQRDNADPPSIFDDDHSPRPS